MSSGNARKLVRSGDSFGLFPPPFSVRPKSSTHRCPARFRSHRAESQEARHRDGYRILFHKCQLRVAMSLARYRLRLKNQKKPLRTSGSSFAEDSQNRPSVWALVSLVSCRLPPCHASSFLVNHFDKIALVACQGRKPPHNPLFFKNLVS